MFTTTNTSVKLFFSEE